MLRRSPDDGRVYIEVFKQVSAAQQQQIQQPTMEMEIKSASFKSTNKKGKLLQVQTNIIKLVLKSFRFLGGLVHFIFVMLNPVFNPLP